MKTILLCITFFCQISLFAQVENHVQWTASYTHQNESTIQLVFNAKIDKAWHLYSYNIGEGPIMPLTISFSEKNDFVTVKKLYSPNKPKAFFDSLMEQQVAYFENQATFYYILRVTKFPVTIAGYLNYMQCNDEKCLPPHDYDFSFTIAAPPVSSDNSIVAKDSALAQPDTSDTLATALINENPNVDDDKKVSTFSNSQSTRSKASRSWLWIFWAGFASGLLALITPCMYPMIPMTVSFFIKRSEKRKGIRDAILYGLSIIFIYVFLGFIITISFGPDAMNLLATNPWFNVFFFVLFVVFAIAFFGTFELQLPTKVTNYFDKKADTSSGILSIFFMAFTLGLVSFSCTGPIIGTVLVEAAISGNIGGPIIVMTGFATALALPFTLFAIFPSWLNSLPKSGGWLNSVKVTIGFLELALALKFLSTADLVSHWGLLSREAFLIIWIVLFTLLGFYLLGKLRFAHDSELKHISFQRLVFAIISFSFALYMLPGLWGAPLKSISAFPPPLATQEFNINNNHGMEISTNDVVAHKKYSDLFHCPHNLNCFFDYQEGMDYAQKVGKPVLLDFTGHGCVNCRKMEAQVWSDKRVLDIISNNYVLISLFVDDRIDLPIEEQKTEKIGNSTMKIRTIGNKWSYFQASKYGVNSQPFYVLLDNSGNMLSEPTNFDLNTDNYVDFLQKGLANYKK